jgi:hypothetical protein
MTGFLITQTSSGFSNSPCFRQLIRAVRQKTPHDEFLTLNLLLAKDLRFFIIVKLSPGRKRGRARWPPRSKGAGATDSRREFTERD